MSLEGIVLVTVLSAIVQALGLMVGLTLLVFSFWVRDTLAAVHGWGLIILAGLAMIWGKLA